MMYQTNVCLCRRVVTTLSFLLVVFCNFAIFPLSPAQAGSSAQPLKEQTRQAAGSPRASCATELDALYDSAEEIFEMAVAGKMERIGKKLEALKKSVSSLNNLQGQSNVMLLPRLGHSVVDLDQAWSSRDRLDTMRCANRITLIAATLEVPLKSSVPTELSLLDYNRRELSIWSEAKKSEKLSNVVMRMHLTWQTLMPKLIEHDGIRELRRFSEIMGRLETARSPEEYGRLSRQASAEIESMKALFAKAAR